MKTNNSDFSQLPEFTTISKAQKLTGLSYLGGCNISQKVNHSSEYSNVLTYIIYLQPGLFKTENKCNFNFCPNSTKQCRFLCLCNSGRTKIDILSGRNLITRARYLKSKLFVENRNFFFAWSIAEIKKYRIEAQKKNMFFAVRLNGTSDINYINEYYNGKNIFDHFPEIQFYDYTANKSLFDIKPKNLHLTFSYKGTTKNKIDSLELLHKGNNIAVVFNIPKNIPFPKSYFGHKVINGDQTDYRPGDENNTIVGLRYKKVANVNNDQILNSCFVINL